MPVITYSPPPTYSPPNFRRLDSAWSIAMTFVNKIDEEAEARHRAWVEERRQKEAQLRADAAEPLKSHVYTALVDQDNVQVWRCARPDSNCHGFDIMITRFGIAVVGDIANLTFTVGASYGIEFLAGKDISYYIHSKLDEKCRTKEFDEAAFRDAIVNGVCERIVDNSQTDEAYDALPDWISNEATRAQDASGKWDELLAFVEAKHDAHPYGEDDHEFWDQLNDCLNEANNISYTEEAHQFMGANDEVAGLGCEWWEIRVDKPSESLIRELYMINHAAKAIMAQKALAAA
jgi:hypothetical protein